MPKAVSGPAYFGVTFTPRFRDVRGRFARASKELFASRRREVVKLATKWVFLAREEAPKKSGAFARSITYRIRTNIDGKNDNMSIMTYSAQPLGRWIVFGTRPHKIWARRAKFLRFYWEKGWLGPGIYQFRSVNHPGTKPNLFYWRASERWASDVRSSLNSISQHWKITMLGGVGSTEQ